MNNSDSSSRGKNDGQFSEVDIVEQATRHVMQPSKTQPAVLLKLALFQLLGTVVFSVVMLACFDAREALSALFGGAIAIIGSLYSAGRLFSTKQNAVAAEMLIRFYVSVVLKFIFTLAMMVICLIVLKVSLLPFIIAYLISAVVINWLVLLVPSKLDMVEPRSEDHDAFG